MSIESVHILLVEDNPGDARLVREVLRDATANAAAGPRFRITVVDRLEAALSALTPAADGASGVDVILLDLALPDSDGFSTFQRVQSRAPDCPIIVLTGNDDGALGPRAITEGAQDYLAKDQFDGFSLVRSVRYARERKQAERDRAMLIRTEAARAEADGQRAMLEASEAQLRSLAETMPQMVWRARPDGSHDDFNRRWFEYTGLTHQQSRESGWTLAIHPDDRERSRERWQEAVRTGQPYEVEHRLCRHDGAYRWFLGRALPVREANGAVSRWFGTFTDIDNQKSAERSLGILAEAGSALGSFLSATSIESHAAILQRIADLIVPGAADWCAIFLRDDAAPLRLVATAHADPQKLAPLRALFDRRASEKAGGAVYPAAVDQGTSELLLALPPEMFGVGTEVDGATSSHPLGARAAASADVAPLSVSGRNFGALMIGSTEAGRRYGADDLRLAEEIGRRVGTAMDSARLFDLTQRERRRAEEANQFKDEFLSVASHELRTPLNAILGWARMLRSGSLSPAKYQHALETIERNALVQVRLVDDILDVSRITAGKLHLDLAAVDPGQVAEAALDVIRPMAEAKRIRLEKKIDAHLGELQADAARLQQVIWNLLANAVKFTPSGGHVSLSVSRQLSHLEISVEDSGPGIDPDFLPHIFEPFRQADSSITRSFGGLGLGLSIVLRLVESHGGDIRANSAGLGSGSTFVVRIPLSAKPRKATEPAVDSRRASARRSLPWQLEGLRILVVDDEPDARDMVQSLLEGERALVTSASSAAEAFDLLRRHLPDVIVSDVGMPIEDGYSLLRRIRRLPASEGGRTPAIALTAYARLSDRSRALMEGFSNHVSKPVEPEELVSAIVTLVGPRETRTSERSP